MSNSDQYEIFYKKSKTKSIWTLIVGFKVDIIVLIGLVKVGHGLVRLQQ